MSRWERPSSNTIPDWFFKAVETESQEKRVEVEECDVAYRRGAGDNGPGLLFIHGMNAHSRWWDFIAPQFAGEYRVAAMDLTGMGDSDFRYEYDPAIYAAEISSVLDDAGFGADSIVVAHSFGGYMMALPTAVGGAFLALLLGGSMLGIPSLIGFLMLMGLAAKNSILLVEYAIEREREGYNQREALLEACSERARPIVMTSLAMMAGMLPTALSIGQGSEFRQPMAIAVIGGLITSTVLSLVLVPVVYEFVDDIERWLTPKLSRMVAAPSWTSPILCDLPV